jgi:hypothetical protein
MTLPQLGRRCAIDQPMQRTLLRRDQLRRIGVRIGCAFEHRRQRVGLIRARHQKNHIRRVVDDRNGEGDTVGVQLGDVVRRDQLIALVQRGGMREERGAVAIRGSCPGSTFISRRISAS